MLKCDVDALAIVRDRGTPDLFITMTCNKNWPEITRELLPGQVVEDRFDLSDRVFKMKLHEFVQDLARVGIFGKAVARVHAIEFQKRGLPHCHLLLWLKHKIRSHEIDKFVCAEIPNPVKSPRLHRIVTNFMMHACSPKYCLDETGKCSKRFPKLFQEKTSTQEDSYPLYRRRDNGITTIVGSTELDNRNVVPYNPGLLLKYNCHINVEITVGISAIK